MLDAITGKPLKIVVHSKEIAYLDILASQMDAVSRVFEDNDIPHWKRHWIISFDREPPVGIIQLSRKADPQRAQNLLDAIP